VVLGIDSGWLKLTVRDDGRGICEAERASGNGGHGLPNMQRRAADLGGELNVTSLPGQGVTYALRVPLARRRAWWRPAPRR